MCREREKLSTMCLHNCSLIGFIDSVCSGLGQRKDMDLHRLTSLTFTTLKHFSKQCSTMRLHPGVFPPTSKDLNYFRNSSKTMVLDLQHYFCRIQWYSFWGQKKLGELEEPKNCKTDWIFIFSTGLLTAQQIKHLPTERTGKVDDNTTAKTHSSQQLFKS